MTKTKKKDNGQKLSRDERLKHKHRNTLRCEWCGRWTLVSKEKFEKIWPDRKTKVFTCSRERCVGSRP